MKYYNLIKTKYGEYVHDMTSLGNPILLLLLSLIVLGVSTEFLLVLLGLAINESLGSLIKFFFPKKRPNDQKYSNSLEKIDAGSFPSIHSSRVMFVYLMLIVATPIMYLKIIFSVLIVVVGYSRIFLKKHFLLDVLGGFVFGYLIFYFISII